MKKNIITGLVVCLIVSLVLIGCGRKEERTLSTPDGKVKVTTDGSGKGGRVEIETREGKTVITGEQGGTVSEAELGIPVYPGATLKASTKTQGQERGEVYHLTTADSWDKVMAFYKSKLKNVKNTFTQNAGPQNIANFSVGEDPAIIVNVVGETGKETSIQVMKTGK